ncbi:MAG: hypothetical protein HY985_02115 [Magnetospirillum sp.]|nr:hypothetical protein [Magnetospirillum sp.]
MRALLTLALGLGAVLAVPPASAGPLDDVPAMAAEDLVAHRGGTETATVVAGSVLQTNDTAQTGSNTGSIVVADHSAKVSGAISGAAVTGNSGITTLMQNTGDMVNLNNATSVNVYLR